MLLNIPPQKTLLRRHLTTKFNALIGPEAEQEKRDKMASPAYTPLTTTAKVRVSFQSLSVGSRGAASWPLCYTVAASVLGAKLTSVSFHMGVWSCGYSSLLGYFLLYLKSRRRVQICVPRNHVQESIYSWTAGSLSSTPCRHYSSCKIGKFWVWAPFG